MGVFLRRWRLPLLASLLINFAAVTLFGDWLHSNTFSSPLLSIKHIRIVQLPRDAVREQLIRTIQPRDRRPREANLHRNMAKLSKAGAKRAVEHRVQVAQAAPQATNPERAAERDPFQPDFAPAVVIPTPTHAHVTVSIPAPPVTVTISKPVVISNVTGSGAPFSPSPAVNPSPALDQGSAQAGSGGSGTADRGAGNGGGGILPFGLGGRGGSGSHRIVYLVDVSPSMQTRIGEVRFQLRQCLENLNDDDLFDVFVFGGTVDKFEDYLEPATPQNVAAANWFLSSFNFIPDTNLEEALTEALEMRHVTEICVITDGVPEAGETDFKTLAREIRNRNIDHVRIDTVGLAGVNIDGSARSPSERFAATSLLRSLSRDSGGDSTVVELGN